MMKAILGAGLVTLALAAAPVGATPAPVAKKATTPADPTAAVHKALQALYDAQDAALGRRDVPQAMAAYAPGYAAVGQDGMRHTRDEEFDALERVCAMGQNLHQHSRIEKIITRNGQASLVLHQQTIWTCSARTPISGSSCIRKASARNCGSAHRRVGV